MSFYFANTHNIYKSSKYNKTDRKERRRYPSWVSWKAIVPQGSPSYNYILTAKVVLG